MKTSRNPASQATLADTASHAGVRVVFQAAPSTVPAATAVAPPPNPNGYAGASVVTDAAMAGHSQAVSYAAAPMAMNAAMHGEQ